MTTTSRRRIATRRIATLLAGPAVVAGVLGGALALCAPANAQPALDKPTCTTSKVTAASPADTALLTRPGQLAAVRGPSPAPVTATSCLEA